MKLFEATKLSFAITEPLPQFTTADRTALETSYQDGVISLSFFFDSHPEEPLVLRSPAAPADWISAVFRRHRIELYVNGLLRDEEWPFGSPILASAEIPDHVSVEEYTETPTKELNVLGEFENAEGWQPGENVFVGDCMPYVSGDRYHVLYLKDRHHHKSKWGRGAHQWDHISTDDFRHWQIHPTAVPIDDPEEGSICTGSHIEQDGVHYLYYSIRAADPANPNPLRRSVSEDGYHYRKDKEFGFYLSDKYQGTRTRDPKVIRDAKGIFHMFITTADAVTKKGCLVHAISTDLFHWTELPEPFDPGNDQCEPECPDYFFLNGKYYILFSQRGVAKYLYSEQPFEGWKQPEDNRVPALVVPKCAIFGEKLIFTGFRKICGYAGTMSFTSASVADSGEILFDDNFCPY